MSFYLSKENEKFLQPYLRILDKAEGETQLPATSSETLVYILRAAANTKYPKLKKWRFKKKHDHVLAIPKNPNLIDPVIIEDQVDYLSIISALIQDSPELIHFTDYNLSEAEYGKLITTCERLEYKIEKSDNLLIISK